MSELIYYQQQRQDGGVRLDIECDDETLLGLFIEGDEDRGDDPFGAALAWYIDLRCKGPSLPEDSDGARAWFLGHAPSFRAGLERVAEQVAIGWDDDFPLRWDRFEGLDEDFRAELVCSSIRAVSRRSLGKILGECAAGLEDNLRRLEPLRAAVD